MEGAALPNIGEGSGKVVCFVEGKLVTEGVQEAEVDLYIRRYIRE